MLPFPTKQILNTVKNNPPSKWNYLILLAVSGVFFLIRCTPEFDTASPNSLEEGFINPVTENRPLALWPWLNGFVDTTKLVYELEEMKNKGLRGAIIWDIGALADPENMIPDGPAFLGSQSQEYISLALRTSKRLGLDLGMVASSSWNAGGPWVDSIDASLQLLHTSQVIEGPSKEKIKIGIPKNTDGEARTCTLISSIALPYSSSKMIEQTDQTISLDELTVADRFIDWEAPEGKWEVMSFFMCNTGQNLVVPSPNSNGLMIDHLSHKATRSHFDSLLKRLDKVSMVDTHMKFLMLDSYEVWPMKDWSPLLLDEFVSRYEYDPIPYLPLLLGHNSTDSTVDERFRADYSRLVSDMMVENHFGQSVKIADKYGIEMLTEAGHGGYPRVDPLKALGNSHIPMGEFWNRKRFWVTKEAASAAHIYGKELVAAESLTGWNHWQHGPSDFKQLIDQAFCEGLNQIVFHTFDHNPEIAGKPGFVYHAGEHINVNVTWWEMARPFMDYIARSSYLLRQGKYVADACLYYGDQAPNLVPPKRIDPNITPIYSENQCLHCGRPKPVIPGEMTGYDYDYMNADIITTSMQVQDGRLVLPSGQSYRVMLLPDRVDISLEVLKRLEKLVSDGAVVVGRRPERTTSLQNYPECDQEVKTVADKLWGNIDGQTVFSNTYGNGTVYWGKSLKAVLQDLRLVPDFAVFSADNDHQHIEYIHRQTETAEIYFITNGSLEQEKVSCTFRVDKDLVPELWDAESGMIQRKVAYTKVENGISMDLVLDPISSRFVVFKRQSSGIDDEGLSTDLQFGFSKKNRTASIDLSNDWQLSFHPEMGGPESYEMEDLVSWSESEMEGHHLDTALPYQHYGAFTGRKERDQSRSSEYLE